MRWLYQELEPTYGIRSQAEKVLAQKQSVIAGEKTITTAYPKRVDRIASHGIKETSFYGHFVEPSDALEISVNESG
jgi:hypothetical protein